ncbi:MAG TPA: HDOD domain-containing protein [Steroidobacteraceae bacterium]|nr:HDOD domain-containing protein [Steroidobacteraceae bacterium]
MSPARPEVFVARQPIYDASMAVVAYELLYRASPSKRTAQIGDPGGATLEVIAGAALEIGLDRLAGGLPVHINFPGELLAKLPDLPLQAGRVVIEVLEDVRASAQVLESIHTLRSRGHRIALDDYSPQGSDPRLLEVADMVKLEITHPPPDELARLARELRAAGLQLVAENVESREDFERCIALGFIGFQGNFLHRPETFSARRVPVSRLGALRLAASLQNADYSLDEVERLLSQDVSLSYRVLRCINSSYYNLPRKIDSIRQAIIILGVDTLRQLCGLLCLQGLDDRPPSLIVQAMTRGRMCEQLGKLAGTRDAGPFFITGLFSLLNALLGLPTRKVVEELPLTPAVAQALIAGEGPLGEALQCTRAYERGAWDRAVYADLAPHLIRAAYMNALFWAEQSQALLSAA